MIYNKTKNILIEEAKMEKPVAKYKLEEPVRYGSCICPYCGRHSSSSLTDMKHDCIYSEYEQHISSLATIPCHDSCRELWEDGSKKEEGKDYDLQETCSICLDDRCADYCQNNFCDNVNPIAYPLTAKQEDEGEEELWWDVINTAASAGRNRTTEKNQAIYDYLSEHYSIKRK